MAERRYLVSHQSRVSQLFGGDLRVVNLGLASFAETLREGRVPVMDVDWRPPAGGDNDLIRRIDHLKSPDGEAWNPRIAEANAAAVEKLLSAEPHIVGIGLAEHVIPNMTERTVLHAGPPVPWDAMCGPMRGAVIGGLIYEGIARTSEDAARTAAAGGVQFSPCHHHGAVGPMAGVITASMPVWIVENVTAGNRAYCTLNEGLGKVLRYGAYGPEVIERLHWMKAVLADVLSKALELHGPIDLRSLIAQALQMGDEGHNRNRAGTSLLIRELAPSLARMEAPSHDIARVFEFLHANDHFFLNLTMPAAKCALDAAAHVPGSSLVTAMARNGTEFGIRVSGTGDRWFTAPAPIVNGLYLPGFSAADAAPDIGDSAITETAGYGGFAMAAAPAIVQFVGGTPQLALDTTRRMRSITMAESPVYQIPAMGFRGTPTGIDVLRVAETGVLPAINTGIAHKDPGVGMVGAGLVTPPFDVFAEAAGALALSLESTDKAFEGENP
jgi:hypothetical protein